MLLLLLFTGKNLYKVRGGGVNGVGTDLGTVGVHFLTEGAEMEDSPALVGLFCFESRTVESSKTCFGSIGGQGSKIGSKNGSKVCL